MLKQSLKLSVALLALLIWSFPAHAISLEEAGVEKGEAEVQYEATYTDDNGEGAYEHEHEIEVQLGITDWLLLTLGFGFEEEEDERSFEFAELEGSAIFELIDPKKSGFGFALYAELSKEFSADEDDEPDLTTASLGIIAEQHWDKWLIRGNFFYITDYDADTEQNFDGIDYAYQIRYKHSDRIAIGVEGYGTNADFDEEDEDDVNTHMVGPVLYVSRELEKESHSLKDSGEDNEEGVELEASLGVLFGTNDETADVTVKWGLEVDF